MGAITYEVESASEWKAMQEHAAGLELEVYDVLAVGGWQDNNGETVFLSGQLDVSYAGRKYIHAEVDGEVIPLEPTSTITKDEGVLKVTLTDA